MHGRLPNRPVAGDEYDRSQVQIGHELGQLQTMNGVASKIFPIRQPCLLRNRTAGALLCLLFCASALADPELADRNYDLRQFRVQIYSKAFAERFELPQANVTEELPKELHAMELLAERRESGAAISCTLKIYFDSALPVYLPEGPPAGSLAMRREGGHFFSHLKRDERGRATSWSDADRIALSGGDGPYFRAAALATRDYKFPSRAVFQGASQGMNIIEYHKEILPGVGYMKLEQDCAWFAGTARYPAGWNLWLKRRDGADYRRILRFKEEDFYIWPVPSAFLARFRPAAARMAKHNIITLHGHHPSNRLLFDLIEQK